MYEEDLRKQAWDFFQMQTDQRLTTFNFYIALSSLLSGGLAASLKMDVKVPYVGLLMGVLLVFLSFIFWKLDCRNRDLIKGAEEALKFFEEKVSFNGAGEVPHVVKRFLREDYETGIKKKANTWRFWSNHFTYSQCLRLVFAAFGVMGLLGAVWSVVLAVV